MLHKVKEINIEEYNYELPTDRIANHPLAERDASKLLVYQDGKMNIDIYKNIANHLPEDSVLVFNNTKVIQARLLFQKDTGAIIEIFILEPYQIDISTAMQQHSSIQVKCMIGGASKWKASTFLSKTLHTAKGTIELKASIIRKETDSYIVQLEWEGYLPFLEILDIAGNVPLPPYIKREMDVTDKTRYQTIYAKLDGSVAAPTAGLHFTENILQQLLQKNIAVDYVTLHVGAGTFKPVSSAQMKDHHMHYEYIEVHQKTIEMLIQNDNAVIAVGTTSVRTLESLYWLGVKIIQNENIVLQDLKIEQWDAYELPVLHKKDALNALLKWMLKNKMNTIKTTTQLLIAPSYIFRMINYIVTNFHQPKSTLLLLVAAATNGKWKTLYDYALQNDFRFLSYGDGCLIAIEA